MLKRGLASELTTPGCCLQSCPTAGRSGGGLGPAERTAGASLQGKEPTWSPAASASVTPAPPAGLGSAAWQNQGTRRAGEIL